jgi:hypothetical protein
LLELGLRELGLGAKTSSGYGRLTLASRPTTQQQERQSRLARLMRLPEQKVLPAQASDRVAQLREAWHDGLPEGDLREAAAALYGVDAKFWRTWSRDERRDEDLRKFVAEWLIPAEPATTPAAAPAAPPPVARPAAVDEQDATAWIAPDKAKRPTLYLLLAGSKKTLEEELRKLKSPLDEATRVALEGSSQESPRGVKVALSDKKRVLSVRLPG